MAIRTLIGTLLAVAGVAIIALQGQWPAFAFQYVPENAFGTVLEFVLPFVPILLIMSGAWIATRVRG